MINQFPLKEPKHLFSGLLTNLTITQKEIVAQAIEDFKQIDIFAYLEECQQYRLALAEAGYPTTVFFDRGNVHLIFKDALLGSGGISLLLEQGKLKITIILLDLDSQVFRDTTEIKQIPELLSLIDEWQELYPK